MNTKICPVCGSEFVLNDVTINDSTKSLQGKCSCGYRYTYCSGDIKETFGNLSFIFTYDNELFRNFFLSYDTVLTMYKIRYAVVTCCSGFVYSVYQRTAKLLHDIVTFS